MVSPRLLNTARFGYSRAGYFFTGEPTPDTPAADVSGFVTGRPVGAVVVGGSAASNPQAQIGLAGSNNGSDLHIARNLYTYEDRVALTHGAHQLTFGGWFQQFQSNEIINLSQFGQATFASLQTFLTGTTSSFLYSPSPTEMNWRSLFGAGYAQDVIRLWPQFTLSLGFRGEFSTGWNEAHGRGANYVYPDGVISSQPRISSNLLTTNNAKFLPAAENWFRLEPALGENRGARRIRHVLRTAGRVGLPNRSECALQSNLQRGFVAGIEASHLSAIHAAEQCFAGPWRRAA